MWHQFYKPLSTSVMSVCEVRRKRKSCELAKDDPLDDNDGVEVKRGRLADDNQASSPTSGIGSEEEQLTVVNITTFTQHEPCDPTVPRVLKSAIKELVFCIFLVNFASSCLHLSSI